MPAAEPMITSRSGGVPSTLNGNERGSESYPVNPAGLSSYLCIAEPNVPSCSSNPTSPGTNSTSIRNTGPHSEKAATSGPVLVPSVRTSGSVTTLVTMSSNTAPTATPTPISTPGRRGSASSPTTVKIRAESMITSGGPRWVMSGIAARQPRPAPMRSAKYRRPMPSGARPRIVDTMIPTAMNDEKIARQMTATIPRFLNELPVP